MKKVLLYGFFLSLFLTGQVQVKGQDIEFTADYPSMVANGEQFTVTYHVNRGGGEFAVPSFSGFYKLMGPQTSYNSSTQIINGRMTTQTSYSYTYYLQATKEGKFTIPPAVFTLKNKEYYTDSLHIEVVSGTAQKSNGTRNGANRNENPESVSGEVLVNLAVDRKEVFMGEPIAATVKLFTKVNLSGINEIKYPSFNNFLKNDVETPPLTSLQQESVNGEVFGTGVIQRFLLYPQISGEITIDPVEITVLVQQRTGQSDPFFGDFFSSYQTVPKMIASKPVKIKVKPLPENKPDDFSGVVGNLSMKASLSKDTVNVNDAVNLKLTITGSGNLKIAANPTLKLSPDIEVYDPKISDQIKSGINGASGSKTFEYLLIPRHNGEFVIPPVSYSYFNVSTAKYETLTTSEFKFFARKTDDQNTGVTVYGGVSKEDVKYLGKDIRFIKSDPGKFFRTGKVLPARREFYSVYAYAALAFVMVLFMRREHVRRNSDLSLVRNRRAGKVAVKRLRTASVCLKANQMDKFYEEILKSLWGYLSDKLNIPISNLTRVNAASSLAAKGIDEDRIKSLNNILDTCEYARYSPSASENEAGRIYDDASNFIRSVENSIR